jgi:hypothetical protein
MPRKKKDKKVMVIGSMVVSVDGDADLGKGNAYAMTNTSMKDWLPKWRYEIEYEEEQEQGVAPDGTPIMQTVTKKKDLSTCEQYMYYVWDAFEDTEGSKLSSYINFYVMFLIICSAVVAVVETIPSIHKSQSDVWFLLESIFVANFTIEFVCRIISCPNKFEFCITVMNWIDLIAILPYYMDVVATALSDGSETPNFGFLRILRLSRAARLIKLSKYSQGIRLVTNAMANSVDALQLFALLLTLVLVVFSSGIYYTERGTWVGASTGCPADWYRQYGVESPTGKYTFQNKTYEKECITNRYYRDNILVGGNNQIEQFPSPFQSIPQSFWWCIVTLTTVGYGDMYPYTALGKIVGVLTMLVGLIMLALPLSIIGTNFIEERNRMVEENKHREEEARKSKIGLQEEGVPDAEVKDDNDAAAAPPPPPPAAVEEKEETQKFNMRKDLREVLAKADQLYESTDFMSDQLKRCGELLREMRRFQVSESGVVKDRVEIEMEQMPAGDSNEASGKGTGNSGIEATDEVNMDNALSTAPVYAVPLAAMEELKLLCLGVLKAAIAEMKIWDPHGVMPEMPGQILELLSQDTKDVTSPMNSEFWVNRLAAYEDVADAKRGMASGNHSSGRPSCYPTDKGTLSDRDSDNSK